MHFDNKIKFLVVFATLAATGCVTSWRSANGHGTTSPVYSDYESSSEFRACLTDRRGQRTERLNELCEFADGQCSERRPVNYREAVTLICEQSNARESGGESRTISREDCARLLAPDGIRADATGTVTTTTNGTDPRLAWLVGASPVLMQDDHAFCMAAMSGYGVPTSGNYAVGYGASVPYGNAPVVGVGGYAAVGVGGPMMGYAVGSMPGGVGLRPFGVVNNITGYFGGPEGGQRTVRVNSVPLTRGQQTIIRIPDMPGTTLTFECFNGSSRGMTFNRTLGRADLGYTVVANSDCGWGEY